MERVKFVNNFLSYPADRQARRVKKNFHILGEQRH